MALDKTGAEATVTAEADRFIISVDGQRVGLADFSDRNGQRSFFHTETSPEFQGRGLATILVAEAVAATRDAGLRITAPCWMVAEYLAKHREYDDIVDPS
jgi:predicted GNAT family acetyltransferase